MPRLKIKTGDRYGRLSIVRELPSPGHYHRLFLCKCDCGNETTTRLNNLRTGHTVSCGCNRQDVTAARLRTHGTSGTPIYRVWASVKSRCCNPNSHAYPLYGARGIKLAKRWHKFENFIADMGYPQPGMTLERIDNNKGYTKKNCRWATRTEQANNKRNNRLVAFNGELITLANLSRKVNIPYATLQQRLLRYGWSIDEAVQNEKPINNNSNG